MKAYACKRLDFVCSVVKGDTAFQGRLFLVARHLIAYVFCHKFEVHSNGWIIESIYGKGGEGIYEKEYSGQSSWNL